LFLVAQKAFDDGFYDVAMRYVEQFQQKYPSSSKGVQAKLLLGQCYFFKNQYLKAFEIFQALSQVTEFRDATLFWLGETYFKGGDYKQAEKNYLQVVNTYANSSYMPQTLYSLGWTYFEQTRYKEAKEYFTKLISRFPTHALSEEAAFKIGESSYHDGDQETAIKFFKDFLNVYPKSSRLAETNFFIAESYYGKEDYLSALTFYAQSAEKAFDPKITILSKLGMGWSYLKLQKFDLSYKNFSEAEKTAEEKNIPTEDIIIGLATLFAEAGDHPKAMETYQKLITQFPQSARIAESYLGLANSAYALGQYDDAVVNYQKLIENFSKSPAYAEITEKGYYGLAWTYLKSGKTDQAIQSFQDIVTKSTNKIARGSALTQIGDAYQEINLLDKAVEVYDQILREYQDTVYADYAQFRQGIALLKAEKIEAATLSFQSLQVNFPKSKYLTEVKYYLGLAYFKKEDWEQSISLVKSYLETESEKKDFAAEGNYLLGLAHFNLKKYDLALGYFQKIVKNFTDQKNIVQTSELYTAKSFHALNKNKEAIDKFTDITKLYPTSEAAGEALLWLGDHYLDESKYSTAIEFYKQFVNDFPGSEKLNLVLYELGQSYQGAGQLEEALNAYKRVTESPYKEIYAKAKLAVADIFSKDMDTQTAIATYQSIAQTVPEFKKDALLRVAEIYKNDQEYQKAINTYEEVLGTPSLSKSDGAALYFETGDAYELLNNPTKAVEAYLKISYLYPGEKEWVIKSYLRLGRIFEDGSQWEQAATIYNKVIVFNTDEAKYAKERLEWIAANTKATP
ncbi:MAG: tetratricopeptide repeat protein, partial [Candidatus Omnitrophica bacterium]|nr:tetratricopeptide repeat protein [Candidatus Omnitrophota bacterium]